MKQKKQINIDYMALAMAEAKKAGLRGEVPIGAVIVRFNKGIKNSGAVIAKAHNQRERKQNALAHAEILAINRACKRLKSWRLDDCVMYVTLEPCPMCAGAILNARIKKVVIGAKQLTNNEYNCEHNDQTTSINKDIYQKNNLNWKTEVEFDLRPECSKILKEFFKQKR